MIKNIKLKESLLVASLFLIFTIFSLRSVLTSDGTIGHLLDWWIPSETSELQQMFYKSHYIWKDLFLGYNENFAVVNSFNMFFGAFGLLGFSGDFTSKIYIVIILALSGITMYFLLKHLLKIKEEKTILHIPCFLGSLFYFMNPVVINQLVGGAGLYLMAYSLSPLFFLLFLKSLENDKIKWRYVISAAIVYTIIGIDNHFLGFLIVISASYILFNKYIIQRVKILAVIIILCIILNLYWILNFILYYKSNTMFLPATGEDKSYIANMLLHSPPVLKVFDLSFNFNMDLYKHLMEPNLYSIFNLSSYILLIFIISSLFIVNYKTKGLVICLFIIMLIGIFFSKGMAPPFGFINEWLYINITPMHLYRTFHHIPFLIIFPYSILIAINFNFFKNNFKNVYPWCILIFIILFLIYVSPSLYGDFNHGILTFREPNSIIELKNIVNSFDKDIDQTDYRIAYLPLAGSVEYAGSNTGTTKYIAAGGSLQTVLWSEKPTFVADISSGNPKNISETIEKSLYENKTIEFGRLLGFTNTKYIILRSDIKHLHVRYGVEFWQYNDDPYKIAFNLLSNQSGIKFIKEINKTSLWENTNNLDHIYVAENILSINGGIENLPSLGNVGLLNNKSAIFFEDQLSKKDINRLERLDTIIEVNKTIISKKNQDIRRSDIIKKSTFTQSDFSSDYSVEQNGGDDSYITKERNYIMIKKSNDLGLSCLKQENILVKVNTYYTASIFIKSDKNDSENFQFQLNWIDKNNNDLGSNVAFFDINTDYKRVNMQGFSKNASSLKIYLCNRKSNTLYLNNMQIEEGTDMTDFFKDSDKENFYSDFANYSITKESNQTIINFKKIDPTKYEVNVTTKSKGYFLIFSETFHPEWTALINNNKITEHYLVNGYANSWYINNSQICDASNTINNVCDYKISLIYEPQKLYNYSSIMSLISFLLLVFILSILVIRNK